MLNWNHKQMNAAYANQYGINKTSKGESVLNKVKLPKPAAAALDRAFSLTNDRKLTKVDMLWATKNKAWSEDFHALNMIDPMVMMEALVLGYKAELTQEEKAQLAYDLFIDKGFDPEEIWLYREGARQMARALGCTFAWMEVGEWS
jgi:hypothetical protein